MIKPIVVECNVCKEKVLLRFQMGYFNIPFNFYCPNCAITLKGYLDISNAKLNSDNCSFFSEDYKDARYYGNFSLEFLNKKIEKFDSLDDIINDGFSPFILISTFYDNYKEYEKCFNAMNRYMQLKEQWWYILKPSYDLLFNKKYDFLNKQLSNITHKYKIKNELDGMIALHQLTLIIFNNILCNNKLIEYSSITDTLFKSNKIHEIKKLIKYLKGKIDFDDITKKIVDLYNKWFEYTDKFFPIIMLSVSHKIDKVDKEKYGITTINFEEIKTLFSDSYELILDLICIPIGLNNIFERNRYDLFSDMCATKNFENYYSQFSKYNRTKCLIKGEKFSNYIRFNKKIKNSISHFDYDINIMTQKITFKDRDENVTIYMFDFTKMCFENILTLVDLNELFYNIKKIDYIDKIGSININFNNR